LRSAIQKDFFDSIDPWRKLERVKISHAKNAATNGGLRPNRFKDAKVSSVRLETPWPHRQFDKDFIGDGVVYLLSKQQGDNHETYGNGTGLGVRVLKHVRICPHSSSRVEGQD
jgi:hypothetical protein